MKFWKVTVSFGVEADTEDDAWDEAEIAFGDAVVEAIVEVNEDGSLVEQKKEASK